VESVTGSSSSPELAAALHRLRSTLARLKAELEMSQADDTVVPAERLLADLDDAFEQLRAVERAAFGLVQVLVIDDDARLGELTARGLRRLGYEAESAGEFRSLQRHEVVVFDLGLASGLGETDRSALKAARPIVVTGATDPRSRALAASFGASDYLVKPVQLDVLVAAINRRIAQE
jgi:CheY-like chemotaxis protein